MWNQCAHSVISAHQISDLADLHVDSKRTARAAWLTQIADLGLRRNDVGLVHAAQRHAVDPVRAGHQHEAALELLQEDDALAWGVSPSRPHANSAEKSNSNEKKKTSLQLHVVLLSSC